MPQAYGVSQSKLHQNLFMAVFISIIFEMFCFNEYQSFTGSLILWSIKETFQFCFVFFNVREGLFLRMVNFSSQVSLWDAKFELFLWGAIHHKDVWSVLN